ncbi:MAG: hypothetical protein AB7O60_03315 [Variibacter sp.]
MTKQEIERRISELNQALVANARGYPLHGGDVLLEEWRSNHDHVQHDIERLEFILKRLPPAPTKSSSKELRL